VDVANATRAVAHEPDAEGSAVRCGAARDSGEAAQNRLRRRLSRASAQANATRDAC